LVNLMSKIFNVVMNSYKQNCQQIIWLLFPSWTCLCDRDGGVKEGDKATMMIRLCMLDSVKWWRYIKWTCLICFHMEFEIKTWIKPWG
jgi:hypothetical protein